MISGFDLLPTEPSLLPFFVAYPVTIFSLAKTYKKETPLFCGALALCRCARMNVVFSPSKKGNGGGSGSRLKALKP